MVHANYKALHRLMLTWRVCRGLSCNPISNVFVAVGASHKNTSQTALLVSAEDLTFTSLAALSKIPAASAKQNK